MRHSGSTVWVMDRDEHMMEWFGIVRVTNVQTIRWVLGALNGWDRPVSARQAQSWCARMQTAGYIDRVNLGGPGGSVVWATFAGAGRSKPDIYRQTTRHEIAVSTACARYAAAGYAWQRDERAQHSWEHQADGVAMGPDWVELIEVELTAKRPVRYEGIFRAFRRRLPDDVSQVTYLCNPDAGRAVRVALEASLDGAVIKASPGAGRVRPARQLGRGDSAGLARPRRAARLERAHPLKTTSAPGSRHVGLPGGANRKDVTNMTHGAGGDVSPILKDLVKGLYWLPDLDSNQEPAG